MWTVTVDCSLFTGGLSGNRESARIERLKNRLLSNFHRFAVKSQPTATKIGTQDHKTVGELLLRDHCSIWSQSMGNQKETKNTGFETLVHDLPRFVMSWGIGWFSSVERLNSRHRSFQRKRNESKRSQNEEPMQERGEKGWTRRTKRESQETHHKMNLGGHEVVRATIPAANLEFLHKSLNLWTSLTRTLRGGGN
jgi:hypothetical protein